MDIVGVTYFIFRTPYLMFWRTRLKNLKEKWLKSLISSELSPSVIWLKPPWDLREWTRSLNLSSLDPQETTSLWLMMELLFSNLCTLIIPLPESWSRFPRLKMMRSETEPPLWPLWDPNSWEKPKNWFFKDFTLNTLSKDGEKLPKLPETNLQEFVNYFTFIQIFRL